MAKKKKTANKVKPISAPEYLPQNMTLVGDQSELDKKIYIAQNTYKEIHNFTKNKTTNESGGVLIGKIIEEFGKTNILIYGFIEAKYCEATPTTLTFTHETWEDIHKTADSKYKDGRIVGWIHTHPNYGIFLSEYDKFIQNNFFNEENQVAYVVDPIQNIEGFYLWINNTVEKSKGFFVYDQTGVKIELDSVLEKKENIDSNATQEVKISKVNAYLVLLSVLIVILAVFGLILKSNIDQLKVNQQSVENVANDNVRILQNEIWSLNDEISSLKQEINPTESEEKNTQKTSEKVSEETTEEATGETTEETTETTKSADE